MKVTQNPLPNSAGLENTKATANAQGVAKANETQKGRGKPAVSGDSPVSISDQAHLMKAARDIVYGTPDIRADKVSDIKRRVKDGTYAVDAAAVADKLVDEHLTNSFGKNDL